MTEPARFALAPIRPDWLATTPEAALEPHLPIIDAHYHLFDRPNWRYDPDDLAADVMGHNVVAGVHMQAGVAYHTDGPENLRPVGETEFALRMTQMSEARGGPRICAAIVGFADLTQGAAVVPVLEAHVIAAEGRFRGIRHILAWDPDARFAFPAYPTSEGLMDSDAFRAGFDQLSRFGLSFDAWVQFHQIPRLTALARAFPDTAIVLDHCGGILGLGTYAGQRETVFATWRAALRDLARCPNVSVKLGGLGMAHIGFGFENAALAPSSTELATAWSPWIDTCIEAFGTDRAMFESNFPVDKAGYSFTNGWNAFKRICKGTSAAEKDQLFHGAAARFYRISGS